MALASFYSGLKSLTPKSFARSLIKIKEKREKMKPVILFDLDGTIIDSTEAILDGFRVAFETFGGVVPSDEAIKNEVGHTLENMFLTLGVEEA